MRAIKTLQNPVLLLVVTIFLQSFSLLSVKYSTLGSGFSSFVLLIVAFGFIGFRALLWQYLLTRVELSRVYPFASLVQVLIFVYAVVLFNEVITTNNIVGLLLMLAGVVFMSRDGE